MTKQEINWDTGEVRLAGKRLIVGPGFSYERLCRLSLRWRFRISHIRPAEGAVIRYAEFRRPIKLGNVFFKVMLIFRDLRLDTIHLSALTYPNGTKWEKRWDRKETARRQIHDEWLETNLGPSKNYFKYSFAWGEVASGNDPREESEAAVGITY